MGVHMPESCDLPADMSASPKAEHELNKVIIHYCNQCRWMLRSAWLAQELLSTFDGDLHEVTLKPGSGEIGRAHV